MSNETQRLTPEEVTAMHAAHGAELLRFLIGILRDAAQGADCLQATFTKLLERGHETQPETRRAWLFKVAYQEAMLAKRNSSTTDRVLRKAAWSQDCQTREREAELPEAALFQAESAARVLVALELLSPEQRQVVRMRIYEEKTFAEIAEELEIPLGTALGRMRIALQKLRKELL